MTALPLSTPLNITAETNHSNPAEVILRETPTDPVILLFDEGDALFNKRSTVEDSHHRYEIRKDD